MCFGDVPEVNGVDIPNMQTPIITLKTGINSPDPIWVAGGILVATGFFLLLVPIEPRGRGSVEIYDPDLFIN